jgi:hypothetical protein
MPRNPSKVMPTQESSVYAGRLASTGDRVGMVGSLLCAVHCAVLPLVIAMVPTLGLGAMSWIDIDQAFTVFATLLGITTLSYGFRRHRAFHAWFFLVPGLALIWLASFTPLHNHSLGHVSLMVIGGLATAAAHLVNFRLTHLASLLSTSPRDALPGG